MRKGKLNEISDNGERKQNRKFSSFSTLMVFIPIEIFIRVFNIREKSNETFFHDEKVVKSSRKKMAFPNFSVIFSIKKFSVFMFVALMSKAAGFFLLFKC